MKKLWLLLGMLVSSAAIAGAIHSWSDGEIIYASDLNAAFNHIHSTMVGGHGARLVNADVQANAAIAHSKLATPGLVPKAAVLVGTGTTVCGAGTCTQYAPSGATFATVVWNSAGDYTFTWTTPRANLDYQVIATPAYFTGATYGSCHPYTGIAANAFTVKCIKYDGTATNAVFSVVVLDNDN